MKRDEIIELANQTELCQSIWIDDGGPEIESLVAFAKLVAAKEREACAQVCEKEAIGAFDNNDVQYEWCAKLIRERGEA